MKRIAIVMLAGMFLCMFVGTAMAEVTLSGTYRVRMWNLDNFDANDDVDDKYHFVDQRFRLLTTAKVADGLTAVLRADFGEGKWGRADKFNYNAVDGSVGNDRASIGVDFAFMQFVLPMTPIEFQIGRQEANWGNGLLVAIDYRDRFKVWGTFGPVKAGLVWDKFYESIRDNSYQSGNDNDGYGLYVLADKLVPNWAMGLLVYVNQDKTYTANVKKMDSQVTYIDVYAKGAAGPVAIKADVVFKTGTLGSNSYDAVTATWGPKVETDVQGLGAFAAAIVKAGPVGLTFAAAYASGDDPSTTENEAYQFDLDSDFQGIVLWNSDVPIDPLAAAFSADQGFSNGMGVKVAADFQVLPNLGLMVAAIWADSIEKVGAADGDYGFELDLAATYKIYENLTFTAAGGYVMPGDYFGADADPITALMAKFEVKF